MAGSGGFGFDADKLFNDLRNTNPSKLAQDVLHDAVVRIGEDQTKGIAHAVLGLGFEAIKRGVGGFVPGFFINLANAGLDAGMRAASQVIDNVIHKVATESDPNPNTR